MNSSSDEGIVILVTSYIDMSSDIAHATVVTSSDVAHLFVVTSYMDMSSDVAHAVVVTSWLD